VPAGAPGAEELAVSCALRHLETRLLAATLLDSPGEYRVHLLAYARKLADEGIRNQAEDLCKSLCGPVY
jgi:protein HIRA/HIR1